MKAVTLALATTLLAAAPASPSGVAVSQNPDETFSVAIVDARRIVYREDLEVIENGEPIFYWDGVYEAKNFRVRTLVGEKVPREATILLAGSHLTSRIDGVTARKMVMRLERQPDGWWAFDRWHDVGSRLCMTPEDVEEWGVGEAFRSARQNSKGEACIRV